MDEVIAWQLETKRGKYVTSQSWVERAFLSPEEIRRERGEGSPCFITGSTLLTQHSPRLARA